MKLPIYQVDAFSSSVFGGNPAAVIVLERWLPDQTLQAIASENNLSETAFVLPEDETLPLRWFTPTVEVDLCGHATLAAGYVLFTHYHPSLESLRFTTRSGVVSVNREDGLLSLDFPARPGSPIKVSPALSDALGACPLAAYDAWDTLVVSETEEAIRELRPNFELIASLDTFAVMATAPGKMVDFVSRFFAPRAGVPEDPVTGSAHCTLIPYWATRLGKRKLSALQVSRRGGELFCELRGDRVSIAGSAIEYLHGEIDVPD